MTGAKNGCIEALEKHFTRQLQWIVCLSCCNELPLRHAFAELEGTINRKNSFFGMIGTLLDNVVSEWPVEISRQYLTAIFLSYQMRAYLS